MKNPYISLKTLTIALWPKLGGQVVVIFKTLNTKIFFMSLFFEIFETKSTKSTFDGRQLLMEDKYCLGGSIIPVDLLRPCRDFFINMEESQTSNLKL